VTIPSPFVIVEETTLLVAVGRLVASDAFSLVKDLVLEFVTGSVLSSVVEGGGPFAVSVRVIVFSNTVMPDSMVGCELPRVREAPSDTIRDSEDGPVLSSPSSD
jgi:hypothetical protein